MLYVNIQIVRSMTTTKMFSLKMECRFFFCIKNGIRKNRLINRRMMETERVIEIAPFITGMKMCAIAFHEAISVNGISIFGTMNISVSSKAGVTVAIRENTKKMSKLLSNVLNVGKHHWENRFVWITIWAVKSMQNIHSCQFHAQFNHNNLTDCIFNEFNSIGWYANSLNRIYWKYWMM